MVRELGAGQALALYQQGLKITERLSSSAPENVELARDLWVSYVKLAFLAAGEEKMGWLRKAYFAMTFMQARGVLAKSDEQYIAVVKTVLGIK